MPGSRNYRRYARAASHWQACVLWLPGWNCLTNEMERIAGASQHERQICYNPHRSTQAQHSVTVCYKQLGEHTLTPMDNEEQPKSTRARPGCRQLLQHAAMEGTSSAGLVSVIVSTIRSANLNAAAATTIYCCARTRHHARTAKQSAQTGDSCNRHASRTRAYA
ncbi:hypothetical protein COO60DRAFT_1173599 [Scenedesmus sp. NREL 46B-D3]|nr:hypothetical protein COO60DRAFT_1173599 [Scenedesmus sp. NREL 46B-D3]